MKIQYVGPFDEVELAENGEVYKRGKVVEVEEELGKRLLQQEDNWARPKKEKVS
jgi:hypothetical protein